MFRELRDASKTAIIACAPSYFRARAFRRIDKATREDIRNKTIEPELLLLPALLRPDEAFFDIGANIGEYVYAACAHLPAAFIYAFEPHPRLVRRLRALFPGVTVEPLAFSDREGPAVLKVPYVRGVSYESRSTLAPIREEGETGALTIPVMTTTVDAYRDAHPGLRIGCMKIDVEGHERAVIEGAKRTLRTDRPHLIVEIEQRHHKEPVSDTFRSIASFGYDGHFYDPAVGCVRPISEFDLVCNQDRAAFKSPAYLNNFIFTSMGIPTALTLPPSP